MSAAPNPISAQQDTATRVYWSYLGPHSLSVTEVLETEVTEAAEDNHGKAEGPDCFCFPSPAHAVAFYRRVYREIPEVNFELKD